MAVHLLLLLLTTLLSAAAADEQTQTAAHSKHYEKHHHHHHHHHSHNFRPTSLFVFGDSYVDTGNSKNKGIPNSWKSPYGSTFPGKPAGRFSNGRVLTDFFARYIGLKSPLTYKMRNMVAKKILRRGMNFAVGGAGVFDTFSGIPNVSTQIDHFDDLIKHKVYTSVDLNNSVTLFSVAGNDYGYHVAHTGFEDLPSFIESVVNETTQNLIRIHAFGVKRIVMSGLHPLGCIPSVTTKFAFTQCNDTLNNFITLHNRLLNQHIVQLNRITHKHNHHPTFWLIDLYTGFSSVLSHPTTYNIHQPLKPCCFGFSDSYSCGSVDDNVKRYNVCDDPKTTFFWDSAHPTEAGWHAVYTKLRTMESFQRLKIN